MASSSAKVRLCPSGIGQNITCGGMNCLSSHLEAKPLRFRGVRGTSTSLPSRFVFSVAFAGLACRQECCSCMGSSSRDLPAVAGSPGFMQGPLLKDLGLLVKTFGSNSFAVLCTSCVASPSPALYLHSQSVKWAYYSTCITFEKGNPQMSECLASDFSIRLLQLQNCI